MAEKSLSIVLIEHEHLWSAQCLEYDIGAQAAKLEDVMYEIQRSIVGYVAICAQLGVEAFSTLPAAPRRYWKLWTKARTEVSSDSVPFRSKSLKKNLG